MPGKIESLTIQGMHCGHCVAHVRAALEDLPGISVQDITIGSAQISYDSEQVSHDEISQALEMEGYPVVSYQEVP